MLLFQIGDRVVCMVSGVRGTVVHQYVPTASEQQTMICTDNGLLYHAPTRTFRKEEELSEQDICDIVSRSVAEHQQSIADRLYRIIGGSGIL